MPRFPAFDPASRRLAGMTVWLFLSYLTVAMALPVVPVYVAHDLGLGNALGGLAVGVAFLSTILSRNHTGALADRLGGKASMLRGLVVYAGGSLACLLSTLPVLTGWGSYLVLILGRLLLGIGESLTLIGMVAWGIGLLGMPRSGRVLALVGVGMYGAFAAGGPLGLVLFHAIGFGGLMALCTVLPLLGLAMLARVPAVVPHAGKRDSFWSVLGRIWREGAVVGLQGVGFAGLGAFISLYFLSRHWPYAGIGLTSFGLGFVAVRLLLGHLPDRIGGTPVAIGSLFVEACGQYLLWVAPRPELALLGALLSGVGCSMVFPSMGREAVRRVPPQLRATAVGAFAAFQDLAYAVTGPVAGLVADHFGYAEVFLIGGIAASVGLGVAVLAHRVRDVAPAS